MTIWKMRSSIDLIGRVFAGAIEEILPPAAEPYALNEDCFAPASERPPVMARETAATSVRNTLAEPQNRGAERPRVETTPPLRFV
ncbi:hypothetical protein [Methylobacterium sp. B4]|uniref:hypothetical protein n=1 Tax=Methylobacterium sp. B4 TaxID=1938755 RepID=UPI0011B6189D|nr:hypothetical protein [Methylobacterium sp. B4]